MATIHYLAIPQVAERIGAKPDTVSRYYRDGRLPEPDAQIGARQVGWLPETIDAWNASRRGQGWRKGSSSRSTASE